MEILKPGLKKLQEKQAKMKIGNFRNYSENFAILAKLIFVIIAKISLYSENCGAIFAIIAKFHYDSENL